MPPGVRLRRERFDSTFWLPSAEIPPRVEYELTPLGRSLEEPIRAIAGWAEANVPQITGAREAYDRRAAKDPR